MIIKVRAEETSLNTFSRHRSSFFLFLTQFLRLLDLLPFYNVTDKISMSMLTLISHKIANRFKSELKERTESS